ncbi:MAG TPA: serine hydrolase domain-containing protein [Planctomycetota bacterium]
MNRPRTTFLSLLALVTAVAAQTPAKPVAATETPDLAGKVDAVVKRHLQKPTCVGLSVGVAHGGAVVAKGYGIADAEFDVKADAETCFRIGSITKQFTAALVMKLVEQGKLALDDPLGKHVPDFPTGGKLVTVRQLLDHTSGIVSYTGLGPEWEKKQPLELTHDELLGLVAGKPFDFEPGTDWRYNNTGYYLLGVLLEKVTGRSYPQLIRDEIASPLGLGRTRYDSNRELIKNRAQGYEHVDGVLSNDAPLGMSQPGAAGALLSTGGDLVRWSQALVEGKVVTPESYARMVQTTVLPNGRDTHYGFGLGRDELGGKVRIHHGGGINGFNSFLFWLPDAGFHVAVVSNSERLNARRVAEDIAYEVLGLQRPVAADKPTTAELRALIAGDYTIADLELPMRVFEKDGKPMAQAEGQEAFAILWQGEREFRAGFDPSVRLIWSQDGKSFELHQSGGVFLARKKP